MSEASESMLLKVDDEFEDFVAPKPKRNLTESEMDMTPMIDVVFLLLIYFLVATTQDETNTVDLPKAQYGGGVSQLQSVVFTVGEGGTDIAPAWFGKGKKLGSEMSDNEEERAKQIEEAVLAAYEEGKTDVVIKADRNVKSREVHRVMKAASKVQGMKLNLAVLEADAE
jgi:biopolymer transport protein ExbD